MSDFFISAGVPAELEYVAGQLSWSSSTRIWKGETGSLLWLITRVDDPIHWSPAWDPVSRIRVLVCGRFAFDESQWKQAEQLPFEGGLAARLILDYWLHGAASEIEQLNGAGMAVVIDENSGSVDLWTDRMGFYPAYQWGNTGFVICSHPDVAAGVLDKAGHPRNFDALTMAEFLRTGTASHPFTYWQGIEQLEAGMHYQFAGGDAPRPAGRTRYWRPPFYDQPYLENRNEIVERLTETMTAAVRKRTLPRFGRVAVMLSAGADSRAAVFAACDPSRVSCFTLYDEPNNELSGAAAIASAAGVAEHISVKRRPDYYIEHANEAVRMSGGMWSVDCAHFGGITDRLNALKPGVVLTGCYADYLMKGLAYNRRAKTLFGRPLPLYELSGFDFNWYQAFCPIASRWQVLTGQRLENRFVSVRGNQEKSYSIAENLRLSPMAREADVSGRHTLRCHTAHDYFMADKNILELAGLISPRQKVSGIPFGMAVSNITGKAGRHIRNNNYSAPVGASERVRAFYFIKASVMRKLTGAGSGQPYETNPASVATAGSWPYMPRVIELSKTLKEWFETRQPEQREFLFDILGNERKNWTLEDWAKRDATLFMRYYTASLWLEQQPQALSRIQA